MYHRVSVIVKKLVPATVTRNEGVSFIWHILQKGDNAQLIDQLHRLAQIKPFTWNIEQYSATDFTVSFSCILPEIAECFKNGCDALTGKTIQIAGGSAVFIDKSYIIEDIDYIGRSIWLQSVSGITVTKRRKQGKFYLFITDNEDVWIERVKTNLLKRTRQFHSQNMSDVIMDISKLSIEKLTNVDYKSTVIPVQFVRLKLSTQNKAVIETALYGGLGEHTGSGFGMVVPA